MDARKIESPKSDFEDISARFAERLAHAPEAESAAIIRSCIGEMAEPLAGVVFLSSHAKVAATPVEDRPALARDIDAAAAAVVAEMAELGARFAIAPDGERWTWSPEPEVMRGAIRRFWTSVDERGAPGFNAAMLAAIRALGQRSAS